MRIANGGTPRRPALAAELSAEPRQILTELSGSHSSLIDVHYPAGTEFPTHEHSASYLALVAQGAYHEWDRHRRSIATGHVAEYRAGSRHAVRTGEMPVRIVHLAMADGCFADHPLRDGLLWQLAHELSDPSDDAILVMESLALEILQPTSGPTRTDRPAWLERVWYHLREGYAQHVTLAALARTAGYHPSHFARDFRRRTGLTPGAALRRLRLAAAMRRLAGTDGSIARIALETGFADQSHMGRLFQRYLGTSPAAFRAARQGQCREHRPEP